MKDNLAIKFILEKSKPIWVRGHSLLSAIASHSYGNLIDDIAIKSLFGKNYIAESKYYYSREISWGDWYSTKTQGYILRRDAKEKKNGKIKLPSYFTTTSKGRRAGFAIS